MGLQRAEECHFGGAVRIAEAEPLASSCWSARRHHDLVTVLEEGPRLPFDLDRLGPARRGIGLRQTAYDVAKRVT